MSSQPTLEDLLEHYTIRSSLFSSLDPLSLIRLQRASRKVHDLAPEIRRNQWNLHRFLLRWFRDPRSFRRQMAHNDAIISGSAALQFLDRTHYRDSDLDVLFTGADGDWPQSIQCYEKLRNVAHHLVTAEGYTQSVAPGAAKAVDWARATGKEIMFGCFARRRRPSPAAAGGNEIAAGYPLLFDVFEFRRGSEGERVQLVMYRQSALDNVLTFHSTAVMNFVAWDRAYALFPAYTFGRRVSVVNRLPDKNTLEVMRKYQKRGFRFLWKKDPDYSTVGPHDDAAFHAPVTDPFRRRRCVVDRHCWRIELETAGLEDVAARTTVSDDVVFETVLDDFCGEDPFSADPDPFRGYSGLFDRGSDQNSGVPDTFSSFRFYRYDRAQELPEVAAGILAEGA